MEMKAQLQTISKGSLLMIDYLDRKHTIAKSPAESGYPVVE